jgi:hypothetical protein
MATSTGLAVTTTTTEVLRRGSQLRIPTYHDYVRPTDKVDAQVVNSSQAGA